MNWTNYDRLVQHLKTMPPGEFNYNRNWLDYDCMCVAKCLHVIGLTDESVIKCDKHGRYMANSAIRIALGVTKDEASYIFGRNYVDPFSPVQEHGFGVEGITEALRRLDLVASRYTRPTISDQRSRIKETTDVDRAFVQKCMEVASEPVEVE